MGSIPHRVCPGTRRGGEVSPTRVPLNVRHAIVVRHPKLLDPSGPLIFGRIFLGRVFDVEIEVPELQLRFRRRAHRREHDVTSAR